MRWLITGGCGFLGTNLIKRLIVDGGHSVRVIDNLSVGSKDDLANVVNYTEIRSIEIKKDLQGVELIVGDICDETLALQAAIGIDVIVHFAANTGVGPSVEDPRSDCVINVLGTFNYLEAARQNGVGRFVFASSGAPIGEVDEPPIHEELVAHPVSPYGASKLAGEGYCSAFFQSYKVDTVALRFGNVYGPGSIYKSSVVAKFIKKAMKGEAITIYGDGAQTRDFIYIEDLVDAVILAATIDDVGGEIFQIATNTETTVGEIGKMLIEMMSKEDIPTIYAEPRVGDVKRNYSDTSKARRMLGWAPKWDLNDGLSETVNYFLAMNDV